MSKEVERKSYERKSFNLFYGSFIGNFIFKNLLFGLKLNGKSYGSGIEILNIGNRILSGGQIDFDDVDEKEVLKPFFNSVSALFLYDMHLFYTGQSFLKIHSLSEEQTIELDLIIKSKGDYRGYLDKEEVEYNLMHNLDEYNFDNFTFKKESYIDTIIDYLPDGGYIPNLKLVKRKIDFFFNEGEDFLATWNGDFFCGIGPIYSSEKVEFTIMDELL